PAFDSATDLIDNYGDKAFAKLMEAQRGAATDPEMRQQLHDYYREEAASTGTQASADILLLWNGKEEVCLHLYGSGVWRSKPGPDLSEKRRIVQIPLTLGYWRATWRSMYAALWR
ncbi:MAG: hypothetical protein QGG42_07880, partial [Phycisphaerae bacterium]|nr:hypothetical protein [Phycisphaerae bacterium]